MAIVSGQALEPVPDHIRQNDHVFFKWLIALRKLVNENIGPVQNSELATMPPKTIKAAPPSTDPSITSVAPQDMTVSAVLDLLSSTPQSLLVRTATGWQVVPPPTINGQVLTYSSGSIKWL